MSYTEQEFNEAMALLDGFEDVSTRFGRKKFKKGDHVGGALSLPDYYNDLNYLMPLAFKYYIPDCVLYEDTEYEQWLSLLRDGLFELSQERKV